MPEGHVIHRYASSHRELLAGAEVTATSPQGRFGGGAARINGRELLDVTAHGKHLFYRWRRAETLHIHLGLYGKFRTFTEQPPPPTPGTRLTLSTDTVTIHLAGPTVCELINPSQEELIMARLGPDPLKVGRGSRSSTEFAKNLTRRSIPIGAALLDQSIIAGLGNIYRAEILFITGVDPSTPANQIGRHKVKEIWDMSVKLLRKGVTAGEIVTVSRLRRKPTRETDRLYVYKRERFPCRQCGGPITMGELANRSLWWCPACQT